MNRQNIYQIIRELFRQNFNAYPEHYMLAEDRNTNAREIAIAYWDVRNDSEIQRDNEAGVTLDDYINWVIAELGELVESF